MAHSELLEGDNRCWDSQGYVYNQQITLNSNEVESLSEEIKAEISENNPSSFLQDFVIVNDKVIFLNHTTRNFINKFLNLDLEDENTLIFIEG